jgi:hypothetical protein
MICALSESDFEKAVSYVSFLRFANVSQGKALADLLDEVARPEGTKVEVLDPIAWEDREVVPFVEKPREDPYTELDPPYVEVMDEFFTPVRSPRLEDAREKSPGTKGGGRSDERVFPDFKLEPETSSKFPLRPGPDGKGVSQPSFQMDDFFMPVRSERFEALRKNVESESTRSVKPTREFLFRLPEKARKPEPETVNEPDVPISVEPVPVSVAAEKTEKTEKMEKPGDAAETTDARDAELSRESDLMPLRRILHLSCADLAFLFDASAAQVYSWFGKAAPNADQDDLLQYCLDVTARVEKAGVNRLDLAVRHPFPDGETFVQKLKRQKITGQDLKTLKDLAQKSEDLRRRPKGATKPFYPFPDAITLYSTPLYCEV